MNEQKNATEKSRVIFCVILLSNRWEKTPTYEKKRQEMRNKKPRKIGIVDFTGVKIVCRQWDLNPHYYFRKPRKMGILKSMSHLLRHPFLTTMRNVHLIVA